MRSIIYPILILAVMILSGEGYGQKTWKVQSPDGYLQLSLSLVKGKLSYTAKAGDENIVNASGLGIVLDHEQFYSHLSFSGTASRKIDEHYSMKIGKRRVNHAVGNELSVPFRNDHNATVNIDLRAYDDGMAFRYRFGGTSKKDTVKNELTEFAIPAGQGWIQNYSLPSQWAPAYEEDYMNGIPVGTPAKDSSGWAFPALFHCGSHWLLITEANTGNTYCGMHLQQFCENGVYKVAFPMQEEADTLGSAHPVAKLPFATPWRVIMTGRSLGTIVGSNLVYDLSDPNRIGDDSWVKPGRSSWSWWSDHSSSRDFKKLFTYVGLSEDMGWEYSLVDANWNIMQHGNIAGITKYATSRNVGITLWFNSGGPHNKVTEQPRDRMFDPVKRRTEFTLLHRLGVKAVKVDFFDSDKQFIIQLYHDILEDAAKQHIMVIFHGCTLPRGWSRTYPNLLSMEAVRGAEQLGWDKSFAENEARHNTILAFTRNVVGPMDYTPVTFSSYPCCPHTTTNTHELALSVLFESGMLHFADSDSSYRSQTSQVRKFLSIVPNVWDETRLISGEPGKDVVLARRSGITWYVAGINGENVGKDFSFDPTALGASAYKTLVFADGDDAHTIRTYQDNFSKDKMVSVHVMPRGGMLLVMSPVSK